MLQTQLQSLLARADTACFAQAKIDRVPPSSCGVASLPLLREPVLHLPNITEVHGAARFEGLGEYMLRSLPLVGDNQFIVLPDSQRHAALELLDYHRSLGLTDIDSEQLVFCPVPANECFVSALLGSPSLMAKLAGLPVTRLEPFIATPGARELAQRLGLHMDMSPELAEFLNHKAQARRCFELRGMLTPGGRVVRRAEGDFLQRVFAEIEALQALGHTTCALTLPRSFSGIGIRRVRTRDEAERAVGELFADAPELLVEPWLDGVSASPSFVLYLGADERSDCVIATTEQWLQDEPGAGPRHFGNVLPARRDLRPVIAQAQQVLRDLGVRGIVGVDLIARRGSLLMTELNVRQTGAIFGALTALRAVGGERVPACVVHNNVPVPADCTLARYVAHLRARGLHYDPVTRRGVIVISHGNMPAGKVMVVAVDCELGSHAELVSHIALSAV